MTEAAPAVPGRRRGRSAPTAALAAGAVGLALFGSFLLVLTPSLGDSAGLQTLWVLFSLVLLKFPLLGLVWWLIVRRRSRPGRGPWTPREVAAFVERVQDETARAEGTPDAPARHERLRAEVWTAVDRAGEAGAGALVPLALRLDHLARRSGAGRSPAPGRRAAPGGGPA